MKNFIVMINIAMVLIAATFITEKKEEQPSSTAAGKGQSTAINTKLANFQPDENTGTVINNGARNRDAYIKDFIYQISEARIMDTEEGKLASQRGTSRSLKDYGSLMIDDQTMMLSDLRKIARARKMDIATTLGESKTEGLSELNKLHGRDFDKKFIKMMAIDHRRDIKKLEKALQSNDPDIQVFATKYLPVVKQHLQKIEAIRKAM